MAQLGQLVVSFAADTARFERDIGRAAKKAEKSAKAMRAGFLNVSKSIVKFGSAAGFAAGGIVALGQKVASSADNIAKSAKAAGLSAEALQELRFAAEQSGVEARQLDEGVRRLTRRIGLAADGGGPAIKMFEKLGINVKDAGGNVKDTEVIFNESVVKIGNMKSAAEQAAAASALFGDDAGPKLALLLQQGAAGVENLRNKKRELGIIDNEAAAKAEMFNDKINEFNNRISAKFSNLILKNIGSIENLATAFVAVIEKIIQFVTWLDKATGELGEFIQKLRGLETVSDQLNTRLAAMVAKKKELNEQLEEAIKKGGTFGGKVERLREQIRRVEERIDNYNRMLSTNNKEVGDLTEIQVTFNRALEAAEKPAKKMVAQLEEIEVTAPKAAEAIEKTGKAIEVSFDNALPSAEDIAKPWEEGAEQIKSVMNGLVNEIGGSFAQAFNDVSAAFANPSAGNIFNAVVSVVEAIGDLFGGNKPPRVEIVNTLNQANNGGINANSPFTDQHGNPIRIAAQRVNDIDRADAQALVNGLAAFDKLIFPLLNDAQRLGVGQALTPGGDSETRQRFLDGDITLDQMLLSRFDQILGGIGGRAERTTRLTGFGDADSGFAALQAAIGVENILASFATFKDDVLGGPQSLEDAMSMQGDSVRRLADDYNGSLESLQALQGGLQTFQAAAAQVLVQIQAARLAVSQGIGATIDQLRLAQQTTPEGRFGFLKSRFDSLASGLGSQGTSAGVLDTVNQLRALVPQILAEADASGLTGAARTRFIDEQISTLQDVETLAQERLDAIERDKLSEIEAIGSAVGTRLDEVADKEAATANKNASTATKMESAAVTMQRVFSGGLQLSFDTPVPAPNPAG